MPVTILLLVLLTVAAATDVARHKIYNWTTYPGILAALGWNAAGSAAVAAGWADSEWLADLGWISLADSLLGFLACGALMLACFVAFRVGGGDVKLLAMSGAFLGLEQGITALLWTFVLGGSMGLCVLILRVGPWRLLKCTFQQAMWTIRLGGWQPLTDAQRAELQPPLFLAPCALAAAAIVRFELVERLEMMFL